MLRYLGYPETDWPNVIADAMLTAFPDTLETLLASEWPEWEVSRQAIVNVGTGFECKNAATYALAAKQAGSEPPQSLTQIVSRIREIAA